MSAATRMPAPTALNKRRVCLLVGVALMYARPMMKKRGEKGETRKKKAVSHKKEKEQKKGNTEKKHKDGYDALFCEMCV